MISLHQKGSVAIYITLIVITVITSAAIVLSGVLAGQLKNSLNVLETERAIYAAHSGVEEAQYRLFIEKFPDTTLPPQTDPITFSGTVSYGGQDATYDVSAQWIDTGNGFTTCIASNALYKGQTSVLKLGVAGVCPF